MPHIQRDASGCPRTAEDRLADRHNRIIDPEVYGIVGGMKVEATIGYGKVISGPIQIKTGIV
jgi:hypothetical protein